MKESEDNGIPQEDTFLLQEKKKDPINQFFIDMKNNIDSFSEDSGEYFLNMKKDVATDWKKFKLSWKNVIKKFKKLSPEYTRFKKLYNKIKAVESTVSEIKDDTTQIKLEISEVATMIETLMDGYADLESYMKENLGSDWKILKSSWQKYKKGEITKWEFAKIGLSKVGKKFAGIFIKV